MTEHHTPTSLASAQTQPPGDTSQATGFQRYTDQVVAKAVLWMFPRWVRPNHLTFLRFVLIPVVLVLLQQEHRWWAFAVFVWAACTDFIDGAMARTRDQITVLGTFIDPVADKLLIASVLAWIGWEYLVVRVILGFILLELVLSAVGIGILVRTGTARAANTFGKIKMVVQSVALIAFLVSGILGLESLEKTAVYLLWVALALAVLSGSKQIYDLFANRPAERDNTGIKTSGPQ